MYGGHVSQGFEVSELLVVVNALFPRLGTEVTDAREARAAFARMPRRAAPTVDVRSVDDVLLPSKSGELGARIYQPSDPCTEPAATIVFFHGGGWVLGGLDSHDWLARALCAGLGCTAVSVDYRLAPENPYPAALDDAVDAVTACLAGQVPHVPADTVIVAGDSAGGGLAAAVCQRLRDSGERVPDGQVLLYPLLSSARSTRSYSENGSGNYITSTHLEWFWDQYLAGARTHYGYASPGDATRLDGLPPALLVTAGLDPLRDEGLDYARSLAVAGVATTVLHYPEAFHGFLGFQGVLALADDAMKQISQVARRMVRSE
jgi:acetyl esterase